MRSKTQILTEARDVITKLAEERDEANKRADTLAVENAKLKLTISASERAKKAAELATLMANKKLIPEAEVLYKAQELMKLPDQAFAVIEDTLLGGSPEVIDTYAIDTAAANKLPEEKTSMDRSVDAIIGAANKLYK